MPYTVPNVYMRNVNGVYRSWPAAPSNLIADNASYSITAQNANLLFKRRLIADSIVYSITGQSATLTATPSPVVLNTPSVSGNTVNITFSGGRYNYLTPQYSTNDGATWNSISNDTNSPLTFTGLTTGGYRFRALSDGDESKVSNVVSGTVTAGSSPLHSEDFEALSIGSAPSGGAGTFAWGGGKGIVNTTVQSTYAVSGTKSARIRYAAAAAGADSSGQLAFDLGVGCSEVTIAFKWRIPENYVHRSDSPNNNKLFRLWPGGASDGNTSYDWGEKVGASMWRGSSDSNSNLIADWDSGTGIGPKGGTYADFITSADFGQWLDMEIYCKTATALGAADGVIRITKNGLVIRNLIDVNNWKSGRPHYFRYGYLMGWSNSGYLNTTDFYLDDINFTVLAP